MTWTTRILLGLMLVTQILGTPGVGLETRETNLSPELGAALGTAYTVLGLLTLVAFGASWKWPRLAGWCAVSAGLLAVALSLLDVATVLQPQRPPPAMIVLYTALTVQGLAVAWSARRAAAAFAPSGST